MTTTTARRFIADFQPSQRIEGAFSLANAQLGRTKNDKPYLRCLLGDKSGTATARMWNCSEAMFARLPVDGFVYITGETQAYQGELQVVIHEIDPVDPTPEQLTELMPTTAHDIEEMWGDVVALLGSIEHDGLRSLGQLFLEDEFFVAQFKQAPAAKQLHHAHLGGLLEHTVTLMRLADRICPLYPKISRDLVMMGCFLQDIGKTRELTWDGAFGYSDMGELVGHIVEGTHMLRDKADELMRSKGVRLPAGTVLVLEHIILSHHGQPEYGAAKVPSTPEAIMVSLLDNLDAKTTIGLNAARPDVGGGGGGAAALPGNFTERQWALGTKLYRPNPLAE